MKTMTVGLLEVESEVTPQPSLFLTIMEGISLPQNEYHSVCGRKFEYDSKNIFEKF